jgi:uncharacterized sodium:solute symporter family permease YidK
VYITSIILALVYSALLFVCGHGDAALVVLGAGSLAKGPAIASMAAMLLVRLVLFLVVPGWVLSHLCSGLLRRVADAHARKAATTGVHPHDGA